MHPFIIAQLMVGGILLSVALLFGAIAWRGHRRSLSIPFALASLFGAMEAFSAPLRVLCGEPIAAPVGKLQPWLIIVNAFGFLSFASLLWLCFRLGRRGELLATEVESSERRWKSLLEDVSLPVAGCDLQGRLNYVNPFMAEMVGYREDELLGTDFSKLAPVNMRDQMKQQTERAAQGDISPRCELTLRTKYGADRTIAWSNVLLRATDSSIIGLLRLGTDMTERINAEQARDAAIKELHEMKARMETENTCLTFEPAANVGPTQIIGKSDAIHYVLHKIKQVAPTDATVLIEGETGVGKELVARALHENSQRSRYPFVRVNCAALAQTLIESELFGHEKGAFTGADRLRKGRFELAEGGTLFLDEIGELSLELQAKLLRVLQEGEYERVGGSETRKANVRVIAATNRVLSREIAEGRFREDLYYRLQIYPISIPPLRERRQDIPLLVEHLTRRLAARHRKTIEEIPGHLMHRLTEWDWPGNVRELENVIERAVIITSNRVLAFPGDFAAAHKATDPSPTATLATMNDIERKHIIRVLDYTRGRVAGDGGAAEILGLHPNTLRSRMAKLHIRRSTSDDSPRAASATA